MKATKSNYNEWSLESIKNYVNRATEARERAIESERMGSSFVEFTTNSKLNGIVTFATLPIIDCPGVCGSCARGCYAVRHNEGRTTAKLEKSARNSARLANDRDRFFQDIENRARLAICFRWHEAGEVRDYDYFLRMIRVAQNVPTCKFYAYTKNIEAVERAYNEGYRIPDNFTLVLSAWDNLAHVAAHNPYRLSISIPDFSEAPEKYRKPFDASGLHVIECNGDCAKCFVDGTGCMNSKGGDLIRFKAH